MFPDQFLDKKKKTTIQEQLIKFDWNKWQKFEKRLYLRFWVFFRFFFLLLFVFLISVKFPECNHQIMQENAFYASNFVGEIHGELFRDEVSKSACSSQIVEGKKMCIYAEKANDAKCLNQ